MQPKKHKSAGYGFTLNGKPMTSAHNIISGLTGAIRLYSDDPLHGGKKIIAKPFNFSSDKNISKKWIRPFSILDGTYRKITESPVNFRFDPRAIGVIPKYNDTIIGTVGNPDMFNSAAFRPTGSYDGILYDGIGTLK